jgi:hypothetical protein
MPCPPAQHLAGGGQHGAPALDLEQPDLEQTLDLLHRVAHRGLGLVQPLGGCGVAAGVHHGDQGTPLIETDPGHD